MFNCCHGMHFWLFFYFLSPWYLQFYEHVCICVSVGIWGIKNWFVYQATEERLCSLPVTDKISISIPIAKYSSCIQNKNTMAFLDLFFSWRLTGLFPFRKTQLCFFFFLFLNAHFFWPWVSTFFFMLSVKSCPFDENVFQYFSIKLKK